MDRLFKPDEKILIGVIHLPPLPGSPSWEGNFNRIIDRALTDAAAYESGGVQAVIVENFGDLPFTKSAVQAETVAAMAVVGREVRKTVKLPIGFNVLRNDARAALALCAACDGQFVRVNVHVGAMLTDQGIIEGNAYETLRGRREICPDVEILADVHVKHAVPLANWPLEDAARDTLERGLADALIVSGKGTGQATDIEDVERVRSACPDARIVIGSGVTEQNVAKLLRAANGVIVGTSVKADGRTLNPVDLKRVSRLAEIVRAQAGA